MSGGPNYLPDNKVSRKGVMDKKVVSIVMAVVACLGLFMPMAVGGNLAVSLTHLTGIPKALYLVVPAVLALAVLRKAKPFSSDHGWLMGVSGVAVLLTVIAVVGGMNTLNAVAAQLNNSMSVFNALGGAQEEAVKVNPSMGFGAIAIIAGALVAATVTYLDVKGKKQ